MRISKGAILDNGAKVLQSYARDDGVNVVLAKWNGEYVVWSYVWPDSLLAEAGRYFGDNLDGAWKAFDLKRVGCKVGKA